ncbi:MAG: hypothetical protein FWE05_11820 [Defluviitaleaceae bacterium]|nr:hypothetical protein [Defluviitaleaceae bacterium]
MKKFTVILTLTIVLLLALTACGVNNDTSTITDTEIEPSYETTDQEYPQNNENNSEPEETTSAENNIANPPPIPPINIHIGLDGAPIDNRNIHSFVHMGFESEWHNTLVFWTNEVVYDFSFVTLWSDTFVDDAGNLNVELTDAPFTIPIFSPDEAFVLDFVFAHYLFPHGGIAFTEASGQRRFYWISESMAGDPYPQFNLFPFEPVTGDGNNRQEQNQHNNPFAAALLEYFAVGMSQEEMQAYEELRQASWTGPITKAILVDIDDAGTPGMLAFRLITPDGHPHPMLRLFSLYNGAVSYLDVGGIYAIDMYVTADGRVIEAMHHWGSSSYTLFGIENGRLVRTFGIHMMLNEGIDHLESEYSYLAGGLWDNAQSITKEEFENIRIMHGLDSLIPWNVEPDIGLRHDETEAILAMTFE